MRILLGVLIAWIMGAVVVPLLAVFVASRRSRNAVPPAPVVELPPVVEITSPRTVTIREGAHRASHRVQLHGEGTSLYGEAERLAKEARS